MWTDRCGYDARLCRCERHFGAAEMITLDCLSHRIIQSCSEFLGKNFFTNCRYFHRAQLAEGFNRQQPMLASQ